MNKNEYLVLIESLHKEYLELKASSKFDNPLLVFELLQKSVSDRLTEINSMINYRKDLLSKTEIQNHLLDYYDNLFPNFGSADKVVIMAIGMEIINFGKRDAKIKYYTDKYKQYDSNSKLFKSHKGMSGFLRKNELVDYSDIALEYVGQNQFKHHKTYYKSSLDEVLLDILLEKYSATIPFFIRLNQDYISDKKAPGALMEAVQNPANPKWIRNFSIEKNKYEGCSHELYEDNDDEDDVLIKCWKNSEYANGIRRIEAIAKRENNGRFSMMIEELSYEDKLLVGRCIHCDSFDPKNTDSSDVILSHIDYAENIYLSDDRLKSHIDKLEKYDADIRGHLFRFENFSFHNIIHLLRSCFKSEFLLEDYVKSQFKSILPPELDTNQ